MDSRETVHLRLLGVPVLEAPGRDPASVLVQPKRLALLAYLAVQGRWVRRDALVRQFWSDLDQDRARRALSQALYFLRRQLGPRAIRSRGAEEVSLSNDRVWCDVRAFEAAIAGNRWQEALMLYRGELVAGLTGENGNTDFSHWLHSERLRLQQSAANAATALADACFRAGNLDAALSWQRRALEVKPMDEALLRDHLALLDEAGDTAQALRLYESFRERLIADFDLQPAMESQRLIARIRSRRPESCPEPAGSGDPRSPAEPVAVRSGSSGDMANLAGSPWRRWSRGYRIRAALLGAAVMTLALTVGRLTGWLWPAEAEGRLPYIPNRLAVTYLDVRGDDAELGYLADGLTEALIQYLSEIDKLDVISSAGVRPFRRGNAPIDTIRNRLHAGLILRGTVQGAGRITRVNIELVDAMESVIAAMRLVFATTDPFVIIDSVTATVARELPEQIGREIELQRWRAGTDDEQAWRLMARARELEGDIEADAFSAGPEVARERLAVADSLLEQASRLDPYWPEPYVQRGRIAWATAWLCGFSPECQAGDLLNALNAAIAYAGTAIDRDASSVDAFELRAEMRYRLWVFGLDDDRRLLDQAEADTREALLLDGSSAIAWSTRSAIQAEAGQLEDARRSAQRALAEDAFLADRPEILYRLFETNFHLGDDLEAEHRCQQLNAQLSGSVPATFCELILAAWSTARGAPDLDAASNAIERMQQTSIPELLETHEPSAWFLFSAVLARAGLADSADAVISRASSLPHPTDEPLLFGAAALARRGRIDEARQALDEYVRGGHARDHVVRFRWFGGIVADDDGLTPLETASGFGPGAG